MRNVWKIVTGDPGHPDQFPYIDQWLNLVQKPLPWLCQCALSLGVQVSVMSTLKHAATEFPRQPSPSVLQSPPEDSDLPQPYNSGLQRPNSTTSPPRTRAGNPYGPSAPTLGRAPADTTTPAILPLQEAPPQGHHTGPLWFMCLSRLVTCTTGRHRIHLSLRNPRH